MPSGLARGGSRPAILARVSASFGLDGSFNGLTGTLARSNETTLTDSDSL